MTTRGRKPTAFAVALFTLFCAGYQSVARADVMESARMLPDDMTIMVSIESISALQAAGEKTSMHALCQDPAMQEFVTGTEKKINELIDQGIKGLWQKLEMENPPQQIPYPEGRLVVGVSLSKKQAPAGANAEESNDNEPTVRFVLLADMGSKVEPVKQIIRSLSSGAANAGKTVEKKELAGVELNVLPSAENSDEPTLYYGLKENWLVVAGDTTKGTAFAESIVRRMGRAMPGSLADKAGFKAAVKTLGEGQIYAFVNTDAVKTLVASQAPQGAPVDQIIKGLGLNNVTGITMAIQVAGQKNQDICSKTLIGVDGPKTGLPALLGDASGPLKLNNRLLPRDAIGFVCANYSPVKIFDGISKIVQEITFMDLSMMVQAGMQATAGEGGQPPVQLRDDVLAQMAGPVLFTWRMEKPYDFKGIQKFLVALSVQDADRLNGALGRIHKAFFGGQPQLQRELLNHTLYLLPSGPAMAAQDENTPGSQPAASPEAMAVSVAGDSLVFGQVDGVEQAIRSVGKEPQNSIQSDPMFRYAKDSLPAQACVFTYGNNRLNMEMTWTAIKQLAKEMDKQGANASGDASGNPMMFVLGKIKDYVDFNKLPEFKAVEKYWGASVGYMQSRPEGLYWESTTLRPPQQP